MWADPLSHRERNNANNMRHNMPHQEPCMASFIATAGPAALQATATGGLLPTSATGSGWRGPPLLLFHGASVFDVPVIVVLLAWGPGFCWIFCFPAAFCVFSGAVVGVVLAFFGRHCLVAAKLPQAQNTSSPQCKTACSTALAPGREPG